MTMMRSRRMNGVVAGLIAVAAFSFAGQADAQTCLGSPSFRQAPYQVALETAFTNGARSAGGTLAAGGDALFGGGGLVLTQFTDLDSRATNVVAFAGADLPATGDQKIYFCPLAQLTIGSGPDVGAVDVSTAGLEGGI